MPPENGLDQPEFEVPPPEMPSAADMETEPFAPEEEIPLLELEMSAPEPEIPLMEPDAFAPEEEIPLGEPDAFFPESEDPFLEPETFAPEEEIPLHEPELVTPEEVQEHEISAPMAEPAGSTAAAAAIASAAVSAAASAAVSTTDGEEQYFIDTSDIKISDIIDLLIYLKYLIEELPKKEKGSYLKGRFPVAMDLVIDSLKNLAIIEGTVIHSDETRLSSGGDVNGSKHR